MSASALVSAASASAVGAGVPDVAVVTIAVGAAALALFAHQSFVFSRDDRGSEQQDDCFSHGSCFGYNEYL